MPVRRHVDLIRGERNPADILLAAAEAEGEIDATNIAEEGDQRRRIDRAGLHTARPPRPAMVDLYPAPVVEGREAPRGVIDPGPAPGCHIGPVPVAIRRPVRCNLRIPDLAIARILAPLAVAVQILIAGHLRRDVARRRTGILILVGLLLGHDELDEVVLLGFALIDLILILILTGDVDGLVRIDRRIDAKADDLRHAAIEGHHRGGMILVASDHLIVAGAHDMHRTARRIDLVLIAIGLRRDAQIDSTLRQRGGEGLIINIGDVEFCCRIHVEAARPDIDRGMGARLGPKCIAACHRIVDRGR